MAGPVTVAATRDLLRSRPTKFGLDEPTADVGIGVDVVDVGRFRRLLATRGVDLLTHVYTAAEQHECAGDAQRLAARFAAKEAAAKALGTGIGRIRWRDVEVVTGPEGSPMLRLAGGAASVARTRGYQQWRVSLSHEATHAVAFVLLARKEWAP